MIVVRDVFQMRFGMSRDAMSLLEEGLALERQFGYRVDRVLVDVTGEYYTLVMESSFESLAAFEAALSRMGAQEAWRVWYARFVPLVLSGRREVLRVVGLETSRADERFERGR